MAKKNQKTENIQIKEVYHPANDEEKILGGADYTAKERFINYESDNIIYKVTNLQLNNAPMLVKGSLVETFIGSTNKTARFKLRKGEKTVITKDINGNGIYKIEVIN